MKIAVFMALTFLAAANAQCLGGRLVSARNDSITVKFNDKVIVYHVTPDTEIWRRGVDLDSPRELAPGDNIFVQCTDSVATMIAAVHIDTGVSLEPHHIAELTACLGRLLDIGAYTLTVKNDDGLCVVRVPPGVDIWRGEVYQDTGVLKIGDEVGARARISYPSGELVAENVEANVAMAEGTIVETRPDRIVIKEDRYRGHITVLLDSRTNFDDCALSDLKKGAGVRTIGLELAPDKFRATYITVER